MCCCFLLLFFSLTINAKLNTDKKKYLEFKESSSESLFIFHFIIVSLCCLNTHVNFTEIYNYTIKQKS